MATSVKTIGMNGLEGYTIKVQSNVLKGISVMNIVGLADTSIKESRDRVESCFELLGLRYPKGKIIINLTPGDVKKNGGYLDLPMLLSLAIECRQIDPSEVDLDTMAFFGGISLEGEMEAFNGMMPMLIEAKKAGFRSAVIPNQCMLEAARVSGLECFGFDSVQEVVEWLEGRILYHEKPIIETEPARETRLDFDQIIGHDDLLEYVAVAAAGNHNLMLVGPAGCGKSMIAQRIETILPDMSDDEVLEVMSIHSIAGLLRGRSEMMRRPFRSIHYNASANAIIGGGTNAKPGEISLAHNGVLFLDEFPEFSRVALESLRQPLEDRKVSIARVNKTNVYPANFMLVAAMNPCPCGQFGSGSCTCSPYKIKTYRQRISGPIIDRMDIQKFLSKVDIFADTPARKGTSSAVLKSRVIKARAIQLERFRDYPDIRTNAQMDARLVEKFCGIDKESTELIKNAFETYHFSARSYHKILKVARTIADMAGSENIRKEDVVSALMARDLDRADAVSLKGR